MDAPPLSTTPGLVLEMMYASLRPKDDRLNANATELLGRLGESQLTRLIGEAVDRKNPRGYRLRVLGVIARIGTISDPSQFFDLSTLLRDRNPAIRSAAILILGNLRHGAPVVEATVATATTKAEEEVVPTVRTPRRASTTTREIRPGPVAGLDPATDDEPGVMPRQGPISGREPSTARATRSGPRDAR